MSDFAQLALGEVFAGRYQVERLIAAGGMGAVYAAVHTGTLRRVALKVMRPEIVADAGARQRFAKEAQVSARLESPNVVDVLDAGIDPATGIPFFAMELLVGKELGELLKERGRLTPQEVFAYLTQAARALDKAHAIGIVHRDLKPENLFLVYREGEAPMIKVLDFGIARILEGATHAATMAGGTPLYMAPEQTSRSSNIGPHTDVWALALTAYTLLVGRPYWRGGDNLMQLYGEVLTAQLQSPIARAAEVGVHLPPTFDAWFFRCVCRDPAGRLSGAGESIRQMGEAFGFSATPTPQQFVAPTVPTPPMQVTQPAQHVSYGPPPPTPFGAPQQPTPFGAPQQPTPFGGPQPPTYTAPQQPTTYSAPPPPMAYGNPPPSSPYGAPPQAMAYGAPAQAMAYGAPAQQTAYGAPMIPPNIPATAADASSPRRSGSGIPVPALVAMGIVAVGVIGFGFAALLRGSSTTAPPSTSIGSASASIDDSKGDDDPKTDDPSDDDNDKNDSQKKHKKPKSPKADPDTTIADPKPLAGLADDPTETPTTPPPPIPPPAPVYKPKPQPPKPTQNCSPGTINTMGRCTCPAGYRSVGPSGSARCVVEDTDDL